MAVASFLPSSQASFFAVSFFAISPFSEKERCYFPPFEGFPEFQELSCSSSSFKIIWKLDVLRVMLNASFFTVNHIFH
jgi:hypothetical protein